MNSVKLPVAVFLSPPLTESFELTLARAVDLKKTGMSIRVLYCNGHKKGCVANPFNNSHICSHCRNVRNIAFQDFFDDEELIEIDAYCGSPNGHGSYDNLSSENSREITKGADSTILTFYRIDINGIANMSPIKRKLFDTMRGNFLEYSKFIFCCMYGYLEENNVDRVEVFNGRIVPTKAVVLAVLVRQGSYSVIEVSGANKEIFMAHNATVHDIEFMKGRLTEYIQMGRGTTELGERFFYNRRTGVPTDARSFIERQEEGFFEEWAKRKKVLSIFMSSPDELLVSGDQWFTPASINPSEFILKIREILPDEFEIIVRMHPNQQGDRTGRTIETIRSLENREGIAVIKPLDNHSSYELIDISSCVLTFGSTIGLEATFWDKPSILAGRAIWEDARVSYCIETPENVIDILNNDPNPLSKEQALKVGSYYMDAKDASASLSWGDDGRYGFHVGGKSYLKNKRRSVAYYASRLLDKYLRM